MKGSSMEENSEEEKELDSLEPFLWTRSEGGTLTPVLAPCNWVPGFGSCWHKIMSH